MEDSDETSRPTTPHENSIQEYLAKQLANDPRVIAIIREGE